MTLIVNNKKEVDQADQNPTQPPTTITVTKPKFTNHLIKLTTAHEYISRWDVYRKDLIQLLNVTTQPIDSKNQKLIKDLNKSLSKVLIINFEKFLFNCNNLSAKKLKQLIGLSDALEIHFGIKPLKLADKNEWANDSELNSILTSFDPFWKTRTFVTCVVLVGKDDKNNVIVLK
ncbi:MAG: hypothetical protein IPO78_11220 [Saprospiraceae bacterium]|nr:hypothetical protein [Saprospiraceae bacterium]MBK9722165.1 hypothetical protein [Saprospiraceae bacterium]